MWIQYSQGGKIGYQFKEYLVETEAEMAKITGFKFGDIVHVLETGEDWIMDTKGKWHVKDGGKDPIACDCVEELTIWQEMAE